jgi:Zn-dependent protease
MFNLPTNPNEPGTWRFSLFGIPVAVNWMFWLIAVLLCPVLRATNRPYGIQLLIVWVVVVFVSILIHEFGHAFAYRRYGGRPSVLLYGMGGLAAAPGRYTRNQHIVITLAGPGVQLVLALVFYLLLKFGPPPASVQLMAFYAFMIQVNLFWALLNLLPIYPLDGGRFLEHLMHGDRAPLRAQIGAACAVGAGAFLFMKTGSLFNLLVFGYLAYMNFQVAQRGWR